MAPSRLGAAALNKHSVLKHQNVKAARNLHDMSFFYTAVMASLVLVGVILLYTWTRVTVTSIGYDITMARSVHMDLEAENRKLRIKIMELKSPERIEAIAMGKLGLIYPAPNQVVRIR